MKRGRIWSTSTLNSPAPYPNEWGKILIDYSANGTHLIECVSRQSKRDPFAGEVATRFLNLDFSQMKAKRVELEPAILVQE